MTLHPVADHRGEFSHLQAEAAISHGV
jgi:hypothetical protein